MAEGRVFLRELTSDHYGLREQRRLQLAAPRVRDDSWVFASGGSGYSGAERGEDSRAWWRLAPGDDPFLSQSLQVHFVQLPPHGSNGGHGHQNEAAFYILEGRGYEIHDGRRYDWEQGDLVLVHTDSVHQHFNPYDEPATALVIKAKTAWMYLGLWQQGTSGPFDDEHGRFGPRADWSELWTPGVEERAKVVSGAATGWDVTPLGKIQVLSSPQRSDVRCFSVDAFVMEIEPDGCSARRWQMADEVLHVLSGSGHSLHWQVEAEIAERYYARVATEPSRHDIRAGDTLYVPHNTIAQHLAAGPEPLVLLSGQNRLFKHLGYDRTRILEPASAYQGAALSKG